jgi:hypothetical protein
MSKYFRYYPSVLYNFDNKNTTYDVATNIMSKVAFEEEFKNNSVIYYEYAVTDGETPEILADKVYGSPERHWIILSLNNILNPLTDWPIEQRSLGSIIDKKYQAAEYANNNTQYAGTNWAKINTHSYYKVETQKNKSSNEDYVTKLEVDANTYANIVISTADYVLSSNDVVNITVSKETKTYYEYEIEQNEKKRIIKLLKPEFITEVEEEFKRNFA